MLVVKDKVPEKQTSFKPEFEFHININSSLNIKKP